MRSEYQPPEGFLTLAQARQRLGVSRMTMYVLVRRQRLTMYTDPRNTRVKLLRAEDVETLSRPVARA